MIVIVKALKQKFFFYKRWGGEGVNRKAYIFQIKFFIDYQIFFCRGLDVSRPWPCGHPVGRGLADIS